MRNLSLFKFFIRPESERQRVCVRERERDRESNIRGLFESECVRESDRTEEWKNRKECLRG